LLAVTYGARTCFAMSDGQMQAQDVSQPVSIHRFWVERFGAMHDVGVVVHVLPTRVTGHAQAVNQLSLFLVQVSQPWLVTGLEAITFMGVRESDDVRHEISPWLNPCARLHIPGSPFVVRLRTLPTKSRTLQPCK
jgi:hypothetical protein